MRIGALTSAVLSSFARENADRNLLPINAFRLQSRDCSSELWPIAPALETFCDTL